MVSSEVFIIYMITTTFCIISLYIYIIRLMRMNNNMLDLINILDKKHTATGNLLVEIISKIKQD